MNNEIFTKTSDLNIHERNHTDEIENIFMAYFLVSLFMKGEKQYKCNICGKKLLHLNTAA